MTELQWFLTEQVEEEKTSREIVAKFRLVGDDPGSLLDLDRELGCGGSAPARVTDVSGCYELDSSALVALDQRARGVAEPADLGVRGARAGGHAHHDGLRHAVPAPLPDAPVASRSIRSSRTSCASGSGCGRRCRRKEWVAVHRCHHAHVDTDEDPHSPIVYGIWRVVFLRHGALPPAAHNDDVLEQYGKGTPDDLLERRLYTPLQPSRAGADARHATSGSSAPGGWRCGWSRWRGFRSSPPA